MILDINIGEILGLVMVTMALQLFVVPQPAAGYGTSPAGTRPKYLLGSIRIPPRNTTRLST